MLLARSPRRTRQTRNRSILHAQGVVELEEEESVSRMLARVSFVVSRTRWLNGRIRRRTIVLNERRIAKGSTFGNSRFDLRSHVVSKARCRLHEDRTPGTRSRSGSDRQVLNQLLVSDQGLHDVVLRADARVRPGRGTLVEVGNGKLAFEPCIAASSAAASSSPKMTLVKINARLAGPILFRISRCETR